MTPRLTTMMSSIKRQKSLTYRQAISWSSNIGMVNLEQRMGGDKWVEYLKNLGLVQAHIQV